MTEPSEAQQIMDEIVLDHGLTKMADRALARALAEALCAEQPNPNTNARPVPPVFLPFPGPLHNRKALTSVPSLFPVPRSPSLLSRSR